MARGPAHAGVAGGGDVASWGAEFGEGGFPETISRVSRHVWGSSTVVGAGGFLLFSVGGVGVYVKGWCLEDCAGGREF